jgi:16S rRNA (cytosine1402-N4)-methyltransferase
MSDVLGPSSEAARHRPVMLREVLEALAPRDGGIYVDGTFGAGGYTRAILDAADCTVWGIDRDPQAIEQARRLEQRYPGRLHAVLGRFGEMSALLQAHGVTAADGVALDIGVSSMQLDTPERGFSFNHDGPLDMRMSQSGLTAGDVVNNYAEKKIAELIFSYGEERKARQIARAIVSERSMKPITGTVQLAEIVRRAVRAGTTAARRREGERIDPATRTFQALRIAVNQELDELDRGLDAAEDVLRDGGRLAVVTFHSLEDRRVKNFLRERSGAAPHGSRHRPEVGARGAPTFRLLPISGATPGEAETAANPRARSARLRAAQRTAARRLIAAGGEA